MIRKFKHSCKTAILEFKCGVPNRGRSMFEGMLRDYLKRTDLWSLYLDQEIRLGDVDLIHALFERAISLSLPPKSSCSRSISSMKSLLVIKERIESVKTKAMEYVENTFCLINNPDEGPVSVINWNLGFALGQSKITQGVELVAKAITVAGETVTLG
ncbi:similar to RIBOSOMAL RNA PROCESSING 5 [Actinidia rufa]|uniref:Similar to RIBOSOMAL RNA PROCESSING 5 n=1 Tax=Actinidia rufa TaxID=165716 RepID=A0A7J0F0P7_9ERIC|nr:similar to RIBOSOMAL RNA PROCESSING 5 [Actinidia rufa]